MACFIIPMIVAIVMTIIQKSAKSFAEKLKLWTLNTLLWGGVILLIIEHAWHGEVVPWPPFLTAMSSPLEISMMLHEITTIGTAMTASVFLVWSAIVMINRVPKIVSVKKLRQVNPL